MEKTNSITTERKGWRQRKGSQNTRACLRETKKEETDGNLHDNYSCLFNHQAYT